MWRLNILFHFYWLPVTVTVTPVEPTGSFVMRRKEFGEVSSV
jgi:hypothetical protein